LTEGTRAITHPGQRDHDGGASNVVGNELQTASIGGLDPYARFLSSHAFELFLREHSNGCNYIH
jgi:hypothetical protein